MAGLSGSKSSRLDIQTKICDSIIMEATTQTPEAPVVFSDEEVNEFGIDLPDKAEYVPCDQCDSLVKNGSVVSNRSYMFFYFMDGLLAYCKHHGERNQARLEELGAQLVMDTRDRLIENRQQGED
jgi:hypothetical protein